jgi:hypothetical protein
MTREEMAAEYNKMSSENSTLIVPLHCGQVIVLLTCWLKEADLFPLGNSRQKVCNA